VRFATGSSGFAWSCPALGLSNRARSMAVSTMHLRRIVKQMTGLPRPVHHQTRAGCGAQLLRSTSLPIGAIASQTGLGNIAYFSRLFRRQYGFAPTGIPQRSTVVVCAERAPATQPI
jgi:AraC-like DNA-binding protein